MTVTGDVPKAQLDNWRAAVAAARGGAVYRALADAIAADIAAARLVPGAALPPQRRLAWTLDTAIATVTRAYADLSARGLITAETGRGTRVGRRRRADDGVIAPRLEPATRDAGPRRRPQPRAADGEDGRMSMTADAHADSAGGPIDLSLAQPADPAAAAALARTLTAMAGSDGLLAGLLAYQPARGAARHRTAGRQWLGRGGWLPDPERLTVTAGAQHALVVALAAVAAPGDSIAVESLANPSILAAARFRGVRLKPLPIDAEGADPAALDRMAAEDGRLRAAILQPSLHNPTGATMSPARRAALARVVISRGLLLIEDDVHAPLGLPGALPAPVAALIPDRTLLIGSPSKVLGPGLRTGWLAAPASLDDRISAALWASAWMAPPLGAEVVSRWIADGTADLLTASARAANIRRRELLARRLPGLDMTRDRACAQAWIRLPDDWDPDRFADAAEAAGVRVAPARAFTVAPTPVPVAARISLAAAPDDAVFLRALDRLAALLGTRVPHGRTRPIA
ncbi:PLP-dependent aminotransferase family protein [Tistrella sp. BH-R2-4]|uniref:PLP-dependent aminotransferase family protein n=1 Tax=Tistrella arctica TaxID=3133430 RepID=A0ABU9YSQ6_9PROT